MHAFAYVHASNALAEGCIVCGTGLYVADGTVVMKDESVLLSNRVLQRSCDGASCGANYVIRTGGDATLT